MTRPNSNQHSPEDLAATRKLGVAFLILSLGWLGVAWIQDLWRLEEIVGPGILTGIGAWLLGWVALRQRGADPEPEADTD